ncbi:Transcription factor DIVARICATA-like protein [Drosera capensis]
MEVLSPASYVPRGSWLSDKNYKGATTTRWTQAENKTFERALALYGDDIPDRVDKVAAMLPGKTGLCPYGCNTGSSPVRLEWEARAAIAVIGAGEEEGCSLDRRRAQVVRLKQYGKGDWRNISRNFVVTRTPTQVASHDQKYFIRQISGGKDRRRASIHDITTVTLESQSPSLGIKRPETLPNSQQPYSAGIPRSFDWNGPRSEAAVTTPGITYSSTRMGSFLHMELTLIRRIHQKVPM